MAVNAIDQGVVSALNSGTGGTRSAGRELQDSFMTLLVAQLQNQDPLNPLDNAEMTSQLAQINTVNGIAELNQTLAGINQQIDEGRTLQAASLIGKGVLVPGDRILVGDEATTTPVGIELPRSADSVQVTIVSASGQVIRSFEPFSMQAGVRALNWNGRMQDGTAAPPGAYRAVVQASSGDQAVNATVLNYALVSGVTNSDRGPLLDLGGVAEQISLDDIRQIL